jgi:hypothetical protein
MPKTFRFLVILVALVLATLACGSSTTVNPNMPTSTPELSIDLKVINETQKPLCYLLVAPADKEFDKEYLNGTKIEAGASHTVSGFKSGKYNVRIHDCEKNMVNALYDVTMDQELMTWTIKDATLEIVNKTEKQFCELYISPSSAPESAWGSNQLGTDKFEPMTKLSFFLAKGKWDIHLVPCDKNAEAIKEIGLKVEDTYTWEVPQE